MCSLEKRATFWQEQSVPRCLIQSHKVWKDLRSHHLFLHWISAGKKASKNRQLTKVILLLLSSYFTLKVSFTSRHDTMSTIRMQHSFKQQDYFPSTHVHNFSQNSFTSVKLLGDVGCQPAFLTPSYILWTILDSRVPLFSVLIHSQSLFHLSEKGIF